jgi:hypothetical protein
MGSRKNGVNNASFCRGKVAQEKGVVVEIFGRKPEFLLTPDDGGQKVKKPTVEILRFTRSGVRTVFKLVGELTHLPTTKSQVWSFIFVKSFEAASFDDGFSRHISGDSVIEVVVFGRSVLVLVSKCDLEDPVSDAALPASSVVKVCRQSCRVFG